jgi:NADH-quinone oxidoreductase subunit F
VANHPKILTKNIHHADQCRLAAYESRGGYGAIRKALAMDPAKVTDEVIRSGIRGRGGAGFPTGKKWTFIPKENKKPVYLINNADESEPGTFKDRILMERDPHLCLEGMMIAAWAIRSEWACIYIRGEYAYPYAQLVAAVKECYAKGYLGKKIFGSDFNLDIVVHRGAGAYICGEETALLNSLEGKKGQPRLKPPFFPAVMGLYNCPTIVNNVETLAAVPWIIDNGGEAYSKIGTEKSTGTKLLSCSGHINKPGVYEVEMGYPMMQFINDELGGIRGGKRLKGVIPGGSSFAVLTPEEVAKTNISFESIVALDRTASLGSGGFVVLDETTDMVELALNISHFYTHESCGQCTPCREGGHWVQKIFHRISRGEGAPGDLQLIDSICNQIQGRTICAFGEALSWPAQAIIRRFPEEFKARIEESLRGEKGKHPTLNFEVEHSHEIVASPWQQLTKIGGSAAH